MKTGGAWPFTSSPQPANTEVRAEQLETRASAVETGARGVQALGTGAAVVGVTALVASGPALPVVTGLAIVIAVGARMYAQNQKLNTLFKRSAKLVDRVIKVLNSMKAAAERRAFKEPLDDTDVRNDATELQRTIGQLIGPEAFKEIQSLGDQAKDRNTLAARFQRFLRRVAPDSAIQKFKEQLNQLALDFSVLQGEFAVRLEELTPMMAQEVVETGKQMPEGPANLGPAQEGTVDPSLPKGGRKTRRRRGRRRTVKK